MELLAQLLFQAQRTVKSLKQLIAPLIDYIGKNGDALQAPAFATMLLLQTLKQALTQTMMQKTRNAVTAYATMLLVCMTQQKSQMKVASALTAWIMIAMGIKIVLMLTAQASQVREELPAARPQQIAHKTIAK